MPSRNKKSSRKNNRTGAGARAVFTRVPDTLSSLPDEVLLLIVRFVAEQAAEEHLDADASPTRSNNVLLAPLLLAMVNRRFWHFTDPTAFWANAVWRLDGADFNPRIISMQEWLMLPPNRPVTVSLIPVPPGARALFAPHPATTNSPPRAVPYRQAMQITQLEILPAQLRSIYDEYGKASWKRLASGSTPEEWNPYRISPVPMHSLADDLTHGRVIVREAVRAMFLTFSRVRYLTFYIEGANFVEDITFRSDNAYWRPGLPSHFTSPDLRRSFDLMVADVFSSLERQQGLRIVRAPIQLRDNEVDDYTELVLAHAQVGGNWFTSLEDFNAQLASFDESSVVFLLSLVAAYRESGPDGLIATWKAGRRQ